MNCEFPPELSDLQLLTYLDGEGDNDIRSHLMGCPYCRERAGGFARLQNRLSSQLYRLTCPSSIELGEYHLRVLLASQELIVAQHLRECPHCKREVDELQNYLSDFPPVAERRVLAGIKVLVARMVSGRAADSEYGEISSAPAFSGLRGEEDEPFIYQADKVRIVIEVQDDVEQMGFKTLLGLVTGLESNDFTIQMSQGDNVIATTSVDEIGNFIISHLSPGHYQLILSGPNMEIHVQSLPV